MKTHAAIVFAAIAAALIAIPTGAQTPQFPQTLQPNTVVGRLGIVAGPAQQVPFANLSANLFAGQPAHSVILSEGGGNPIVGVPPGTSGLPWVSNGAGVDPAYGPVEDKSTVIGNGAAKFNPLFFGMAGTGVVHRFNRVFVGEATASSSDIGPVTTKDWLETLVPNTTGISIFTSVDTTGNLAVVGGSRCSDARTAFGSSSGGCQGGTFYGYNDDTVGGAISCGVCGTAIRKSGAIGDAINQFDIINGNTVVDVTPFSGTPSGGTIAALMTAGALTPAGFTVANSTAAWVIGAGVSARHRKGGVCQDGAIDVALGGGGDGICLEMARNQSVRWLNSGGGTDGEMWANATGIHFTDAAWQTYTPSPVCGTATFTVSSAKFKTLGKVTYVSFDILITAIGTCTQSLTFTLPATANGAYSITGKEFNNSNVMLGCVTSAASATATCTQSLGTAYGVNNRLVLTGEYENQ